MDEWNLSSFEPDWSFAPSDWRDDMQLKELHEATESRKLNWDQLGDGSPAWALYIAIGGAALSVCQLMLLLLFALNWRRKPRGVSRSAQCETNNSEQAGRAASDAAA